MIYAVSSWKIILKNYVPRNKKTIPQPQQSYPKHSPPALRKTASIQTLIIAFEDSLKTRVVINFSGNVHPTSTI